MNSTGRFSPPPLPVDCWQHVATPWLDKKHSVFGKVADAESQSVVDSIEQDDLIESVDISGDMKEDDELQKTLADWNKTLDTILA